MLVTKPAVVTDGGINLQILNMSGEEIEFTKLEVGSGRYSDEEATKEELRQRTSLKDQKQLFGISSMTVADDGDDGKALIFSIMITNADLKEEYTIRELGLYARIKDQPDTECLASISLAEIEDDFPAYDGHAEGRILMRYHFTVSNTDTVYLSYEHDPVALVEYVDKKYNLLEIEITELKKNFETLREYITKLFPDLPAPSKDDAGKTVVINCDGKAVWENAKDKRDLIDNFRSIHTEFNADGSITETDASGNTKHTVFNDDGSITETLKDADENVIATKTTTFNADGSIDEEVV